MQYVVIYLLHRYTYYKYLTECRFMLHIYLLNVIMHSGNLCIHIVVVYLHNVMYHIKMTINNSLCFFYDSLQVV